MLLILVIAYVLQHLLNADAAPFSLNFPREAPIGSQECVCPNTRSVWDIVWSCLVTIFACSWVSVHPNIPKEGLSQGKKILRRFEIVFWSIIAPELIIGWAMRQFFGAVVLKMQYGGEGWTMAHGYFIQMGGFMLYEDGKAVGVLDPGELDGLISMGRITLPSITEEEIKDRSKGDGLSKAVVIVQTTWFIVQCIARRVQGLAITQLELATVGFAALNAVMYAFWWHKPLNVETTVPVHAALPKAPNQSMSPDSVDSKRAAKGILQVEMRPMRPTIFKRKPSTLRIPTFIDLTSRPLWFPFRIFRWPLEAVAKVNDTNSICKGKMHVPNFYASADDQGMRGAYYLLVSVGTIFGAIHCVGWEFTFPSIIEAKIWRVCSVTITSISLVTFVLGWFGLNLLYNGIDGYGPDLVACMLGSFIGWYILARVALLVGAIISLRNLPPPALGVVEWTLSIPHV
ncbi:hypothetical protein GALMADRAFT_1360429 [Galerina marginata CBS 339.88]|uniref:Uncharacterized protein n=1 Tax=Galerina marginata (strain CBS 339.88) TaxID=685588 RepID=A0A067T966_GALM3|nr:hypothetical protein GALMADRAFT_1360429 [Galerina marginata CBS 339.88]